MNPTPSDKPRFRVMAWTREQAASYQPPQVLSASTVLAAIQRRKTPDQPAPAAPTPIAPTAPTAPRPITASKPRKAARRNAERRPRMSAEEARTFDRYSIANATAVAHALAERGTCPCEPYSDVFTFHRWIAQGSVVQKGQKAIRVQTWSTDEHETEEGDIELVRRSHTAFLFCRCQVAPTQERRAS